MAAIHINIWRLASTKVRCDEHLATHLTETPPPNQGGAAVLGVMLVTGRLPFVPKIPKKFLLLQRKCSRGRGGRGGRNKDRKTLAILGSCYVFVKISFLDIFFFFRIGSWNTESSCCLSSTSILISPAKAAINTEGAMLSGMMHLDFSCCSSAKNLSRRITSK